MRFRLWGVAASAVLVLAGESAQAAEVGKPAHEFSVVTFDNQKVSSADLKGKVVVLNYWATWCTPCRAEMLVFDDYMRSHPKTDLKIYAVATEDSVPERFLRPLAAAAHFSLVKKLHGRGYGVMAGVPTSYVIGRDGLVRHAEAGAFDRRSFAELVDPLLAEPAPAEPAPAGPASITAAR